MAGRDSNLKAVCAIYLVFLEIVFSPLPLSWFPERLLPVNAHSFHRPTVLWQWQKPSRSEVWLEVSSGSKTLKPSPFCLCAACADVETVGKVCRTALDGVGTVD